ncbi:MAG: TDT family transporter [Clostridium sp.]|nr:TDT family transporter [Clostridium sp.]
MKTFLKKIENLPVPILPTMVGAATLSNVYLTLGYTYIRHITMIAATIILICYIIKIALYPGTFRKEYSNTVPASLYAGLTMISMILGSYYFDFNNFLGKAIWLIATILHAIHILVFTYRNVFKGINMDTFVPSWFVTYNGIMVSTVVGGVMNEPFLGKIIVYYGIFIFVLIIPFIIYRLMNHPIKDAMFHTQAIVLAPSSLCVVGYLNYIKEPNFLLVSLLYLAVLGALIFIAIKIPAFFKYDFHPGFAGLTFPMAIGIVASIKMSAFLVSRGYESLGSILKELSGIQIYVTTAIVVFVLYNFSRMFVRSYKKE